MEAERRHTARGGDDSTHAIDNFAHLSLQMSLRSGWKPEWNA